MSIRYLWNPGLDKEIKNNLKNGLFSDKEVEGIFKILSNLYRARLKTFQRLTIFLAVMFLVMLLLQLIYVEDTFIAVVSVLVTLLFTAFLMVCAYFIWVVKERDQFTKCVKTGYPHLAEKFKFKK